MVSMHHLLNQWMDIDQTCIDTLLGRFQNRGFGVLSSKQEDGFFPNLHTYIVGRRGRVD